MPAYRIKHAITMSHGHGWETHLYRAVFLGQWRHLFARGKTSVRIKLDSKQHFDTNSAKVPDYLTFRFNKPGYTIIHNGQDIMDWLRQNLVGKATLYVASDHSIDMNTFQEASWDTDLEVVFTNKGDAMMFKLIHGGIATG